MEISYLLITSSFITHCFGKFSWLEMGLQTIENFQVNSVNVRTLWCGYEQHSKAQNCKFNQQQQRKFGIVIPKLVQDDDVNINGEYTRPVWKVHTKSERWHTGGITNNCLIFTL